MELRAPGRSAPKHDQPNDYYGLVYCKRLRLAQDSGLLIKLDMIVGDRIPNEMMPRVGSRAQMNSTVHCGLDGRR